MENWAFLTNYGQVLLCIALDPESRLKDVAAKVGITERATQRIIADLLAAGYLSSQKRGRRNYYKINRTLPFRHPVERHNQIGQLLRLVSGSKKGKPLHARVDTLPQPKLRRSQKSR